MVISGEICVPKDRRVLYRAWGLTAYRWRARLMLDRRGVVQAPVVPRDQSQHPRVRNAYYEETAYEKLYEPEPGFQSGPGCPVDANLMAPCLLVTKTSPPSGRLRNVSAWT